MRKLHLWKEKSDDKNDCEKDSESISSQEEAELIELLNLNHELMSNKLMDDLQIPTTSQQTKEVIGQGQGTQRFVTDTANNEMEFDNKKNYSVQLETRL